MSLKAARKKMCELSGAADVFLHSHYSIKGVLCWVIRTWKLDAEQQDSLLFFRFFMSSWNHRIQRKPEGDRLKTFSFICKLKFQRASFYCVYLKHRRKSSGLTFCLWVTGGWSLSPAGTPGQVSCQSQIIQWHFLWFSSFNKPTCQI